MGQRPSTEEARMADRVASMMRTYMDLGTHIEDANRWATLCPTPKTCQLRFRLVLNERIAPDVMPYVWKVKGNVMVEARKIRRLPEHDPPRDINTWEALESIEHTIGSPKLLTIQQFYYVLCFLSDVNDCAVHTLTIPSDTEKEAKDFDDFECQICMDKQKEVVLPCSHSFCLRCFQTWSTQNQTCPICRSRIYCAEGEELWHLTSNDIRDIASYAKDLISRIYEFLDKQDMSHISHDKLIASAANYNAWRIATLETRLDEEPQGDDHSRSSSFSLPPTTPTLDSDYIFALALAAGEDQERALAACGREQGYFPTLNIMSSSSLPEF
ncbi:hypothetical protein SDRG_17113 [Saprolegnia diclina VS20]|uniref:RING finger protein 141 n=1 Tax=Saprolegnia diclina (strain VS20) TaxID=1156394 RepID=T0QZ30_SAPDV|nr:hypothetical protein SDRG_17113 [Saprolegnia diclina VS20]EQC24993.1 hypothetical protein SDRG_17113 [Saprolegnia diclina VS20]|eukprot:XP_008621570.1 hypothetical protein SDRG_17113 [Saprolegnia diclina VS20]